MDWKLERAVQEKVRDFHKQKRLLKHAEGRTLYAHLQMVTSPRLLIDNELSPQGASAATVCQTSYHQWPDLFTITSTPWKFAECLYCVVNPSPILHVLFCPIESLVICSLYGRSSHIHAFMHPHINTFIYSHIQACTTRTYTPISIYTWLHQSPRVWFGHITSIQPSIYFCLSSKWQVLHNRQLKFTFVFLPSGKSYITNNLSFIFVFLPSGKSYITGSLRFIFRLSSKWRVLYNGKLEIYFFSFFQVASPI